MPAEGKSVLLAAHPWTERELAIYEVGYRNGESSREADYSFAFGEVIDDEAGYAAWSAMELAEWVKAKLAAEFERGRQDWAGNP